MPANSDSDSNLDLNPSENPDSPASEVNPDPPTPTVPTDWEARCTQLQHQLSVLKEVSTLRKSLLDLRDTETKSLISKLKVLEEAINTEKRSRLNLLKRVEAAELECINVKDRLRRNVETLDRMRIHNEERVASLMANLEISELQLKDSNSCWDESKRKNAELKGQLEELNMKLNENRKYQKGLELRVKRSEAKELLLASQVTLISGVLDKATESEGQGQSSSSDVIADAQMQKIKDILRSKSTSPSDSVSDKEKDLSVDEGVELSTLLSDEDTDEVEEDIPGEESCYKTVDTKNGPELILSVSRTYIKLKDLILEKRSLQKEIDNLKGLNNKLESKVDKQEHRLYCVTKELNRTWTLVSKLKMQQDRFHNSEAVLKYELKEKRALLERLKKELSIYRDKWRKVREKNSESQSVWQQLRDEFAQRRLQSLSQSSESTDTETSANLTNLNNNLESDVSSAEDNANNNSGESDRQRSL